MISASRSDLVALTKATIWSGLQLYAHAAGCSAVENSTVRAICTGAHYEGFNAAVGTDATTRDEIKDVLSLFRERGVPMLWHVWESEAAIEQSLVAEGLVFYEEEPAMILELDLMATTDLPPVG